MTASNPIVATVDADLEKAGLPTYSEIVALLSEAAKLGLNFDCGRAYIYRAYVTHQDELQAKIKAVKTAIL